MRINDTIKLEQTPVVLGWAAVGGKKEAEGPLKDCFDVLVQDSRMSETSWEMAERTLMRTALEKLIEKTNVPISDLHAIFAGDLQCQCTSSAYLMKSIDVPFIGLYGACSTSAEGIALASCLVESDIMSCAGVCVSSHFCSAERQFRTPLDYGGKRTPNSQWTVTGAGALMIAKACETPLPTIQAVTFGRVRDYEIKDINNMGAAMAPAACQTLLNYFRDTNTSPSDFDVIYTGDLGAVGSELLCALMEREGITLSNHQDCGLLIYDMNTQDVGAGGSGAGCSMSVLCSQILPKLTSGEIKRCLYIATGALMSQLTALQKESIPAIAHLIEFHAPKGGDET